jgi:hypothetical protein
MLVSTALYLLMILPAEYSGLATVSVSAQAAARSNVFQLANPMGASDRLLHDVIMGNASAHQVWLWVTTPVVFPIVVLSVLFLYAGPGLRLEAGAKALRARTT